MITAVQFLVSSMQGTETADSEVFHVLLQPLLQLLGLVARAKFDDDTRHSLGDILKFAARLFTVCVISVSLTGLKGLESSSLTPARAVCPSAERQTYRWRPDSSYARGERQGVFG